MVNVSRTGHLSRSWAELGPATDIRSTVNAVEYTQPCFRSRLRRRLSGRPLRCLASLANHGTGGAGVDEELAMEIVPTSGFGWRSSMRSGPYRRQGQ
jgi:hypothetical protein